MPSQGEMTQAAPKQRHAFIGSLAFLLEAKLSASMDCRKFKEHPEQPAVQDKPQNNRWFQSQYIDQ